jgi:hypothetical protein
VGLLYGLELGRARGDGRGGKVQRREGGRVPLAETLSVLRIGELAEKKVEHAILDRVPHPAGTAPDDALQKLSVGADLEGTVIERLPRTRRATEQS